MYKSPARAIYIAYRITANVALRADRVDGRGKTGRTRDYGKLKTDNAHNSP